MKMTLVALLLAPIVSLSAFAQTAAKEEIPPQIPLRDFFRNADMIQVRLSPDGRTLAWLAPYKDRMNVFVKAVGSTDPARQITFITERSISRIYWKGSQHILFERDKDGDENDHVYSVDINTQNILDLTPWEGAKSGIENLLFKVDDQHVLIYSNKRNKEIFDIYKLNVSTGEASIVVQNPGDISYYLTDHDGKVRFASRTAGLNDEILFRANENEEFRKVLTIPFTDSWEPMDFDYDDPNKMYVATNLGRDRKVLAAVNMTTMAEENILVDGGEYDVGGVAPAAPDLVMSDVKRKPVMATYYDVRYRHVFFDPEYEQMYADLQQQLGKDVDISIKSATEDERTFLVVAQSDRIALRYYIYNMDEADAGKRLQFIVDGMPWLRPEHLAEMKPVTYQARDGETIHAYLTLPKGRDPKNLPVIINPHGGPWGVRDKWGFNPEVQFLANRGYAVLQPNYRGSGGYGRRWITISHRQWGGTMQDDLTDGVAYLINSGIADPKRVGIMGGSYGGYATLAGITFTPNLYAVAVDAFGVSNLFTFLKTIPPYWKLGQEQYRQRLGDPENVVDREILAAASPALHADRIKTPLLVAQGRMDPRVNIAESDQIVEAARKNGVEVQYLVFDNEGHGFVNQENSFTYYEAVEKFLARYLKPEVR